MKEFKVPLIWQSALEYIEKELDFSTDEGFSSPFRNSASSYSSPVFKVHAYNWTDWTEEKKEYNFKWRDVEICWYKELSRSMVSNKKLTSKMAEKMLEDCIKYINSRKRTIA